MSDEHSDGSTAIAELQLPERIVFLDVNGTLIPSDSPNGYVSDTDKSRLRSAVETAQERGWTVGLCSDSPLGALQGFAIRMGLGSNIPIIAENGNLVAYRDKTAVVRSLSDVDALKRKVVELASISGIEEAVPVLAPEFGGAPLSAGDVFAFGAGRTTSLAVFGPPFFINKLRFIGAGLASVGMDVSPQFGYFALHPIPDFRNGKRLTLDLLAGSGNQVVMVGDSVSDFTPSPDVACAFVFGHTLPPALAMQAWCIADAPLIEGVVQILNNVSTLSIEVRDSSVPFGTGR